MSLKQRPEIRRLIVFATVGTLNTAVCYALYAALVHALAWHHNAALVADYALGSVAGFVSHRLATFADRKHVRRALGKYLLTLVATFLLNAILLNAIVISRLLGPLLGQAAAMTLVTMVSYLMQKHWVFRSHQQQFAVVTADNEPIRDPARRRTAA